MHTNSDVLTIPVESLVKRGETWRTVNDGSLNVFSEVEKLLKTPSTCTRRNANQMWKSTSGVLSTSTSGVFRLRLQFLWSSGFMSLNGEVEMTCRTVQLIDSFDFVTWSSSWTFRISWAKAFCIDFDFERIIGPVMCVKGSTNGLVAWLGGSMSSSLHKLSLVQFPFHWA